MGYAVLLIAAFFLAIAGLVFAAAAAIVLAVGKWSTPRRRKLWIGLPFILGILPITLLFAPLMISSVTDALRPASWAYQDVFGTPPAGSITGLLADTQSGFDTRMTFLEIARTPAAQAELARLLIGARSQQTSDLADSIVFNGSAPDWWRGGRAWVGAKGCADVTQANYVDFGSWRDLVIADCPSQQRIYILAHRVD